MALLDHGSDVTRPSTGANSWKKDTQNIFLSPRNSLWLRMPTQPRAIYRLRRGCSSRSPIRLLRMLLARLEGPTLRIESAKSDDGEVRRVDHYSRGRRRCDDFNPSSDPLVTTSRNLGLLVNDSGVFLPLLVLRLTKYKR